MAKRPLNDLEAEVAFDRCWDIYKVANDNKRASAFKAFLVANRLGEDMALVEIAAKIYVLETQGDEYHYQFGNFIRDDHWKDYVGEHVDWKSYLASLEAKEAAAVDLLRAWNEGIPHHWCPVLDVRSKIPLAKRALSDPAFKERWQEALDLARKIFYKPLHSTDLRSKIILSFAWFTKLGDKHTVMRLVERELGTPESTEKPLPPRPKELTPEELEANAKEARELWKEVFGYYPESKKKPDEKPAEPPPEIPGYDPETNSFID
jgi:hypothetical protein